MNCDAKITNNFINDKDMTEELENRLTERFEHLVETSQNGFSLSADIEDALLKAYLAGGEYGYELGVKSITMINLSANEYSGNND